MTVAELIEWLKTKPQDATVVIHDAETDWFLPLKIGVQPGSLDDERAGTIAVHGEYDEALPV